MSTENLPHPWELRWNVQPEKRFVRFIPPITAPIFSLFIFSSSAVSWLSSHCLEIMYHVAATSSTGIFVFSSIYFRPKTPMKPLYFKASIMFSELAAMVYLLYPVACQPIKPDHPANVTP
jgi:hypothetical protein